jgi:hypothetical protein
VVGPPGRREKYVRAGAPHTRPEPPDEGCSRLSYRKDRVVDESISLGDTPHGRDFGHIRKAALNTSFNVAEPEIVRPDEGMPRGDPVAYGLQGVTRYPILTCLVV